MFSTIGIAATGVAAHRAWLDAVSDNIANINDVTSTGSTAYQERFVAVREAADGKGVAVTGVDLGSGAGVEEYQPGHPLADANGMIRRPDIDLGTEMGDLIMAQRGYQANLSVVDRAHDAYLAAMQLGRNA
jgi:flagellar basal-body rod protein FlgC